MPGAPSASDQFRQQRARQAIRVDQDQLLRRASHGVDPRLLKANDGKDNARAILIAATLMMSCVASYGIVMWSWFFVYHHSIVRFASMLAGVVIAGGLLCVGSSRRVLGVDRPRMYWLGFMALQAAAVALVAGFFLFFQYLCYYWKYEEMRTYTNVGAAQYSSGFRDASMILFTEDTRLDPMRAVGYQSRWDGSLYCVAPIVDKTMSTANEVSYYAIGTDCCSTRAEFHCGDAEDFSTRSGLVVLEPDDVVRPFMRWAVRGAAYPRYQNAIQLQEANYFTKAAKKPMLVLWSRDPIALKDSFLNDARDACMQISVAYLLAMSAGSFWLATALVPKLRPEGVIRHGY